MNTRTLPALALAVALSALAARPATAQTTYIAADTTINYGLNNSAIVGYANQSDFVNGLNGTSPTIGVVNGGSVNGNLLAHNGSKINVGSGASLSLLTTRDTSISTISGGSVGSVQAGDNSRVSISGGAFSSELDAFVTSTVQISGGTFATVTQANNSTTVTINGGSFGSSFGVHFVDGTTGAFTFVGTGLSALNIGPDSHFGGTDYRLTGILQNGQSITGDVIDVRSGAAMFTLVTAPEPSQTAALGLGALTLGGLWLKARRRLSAHPNS